MFDLIAIAALTVSAVCAIGSSLWALWVYRGKRDEQDAKQGSDNASFVVTKLMWTPSKHTLEPLPQKTFTTRLSL